MKKFQKKNPQGNNSKKFLPLKETTLKSFLNIFLQETFLKNRIEKIKRKKEKIKLNEKKCQKKRETPPRHSWKKEGVK